MKNTFTLPIFLLLAFSFTNLKAQDNLGCGTDETEYYRIAQSMPLSERMSDFNTENIHYLPVKFHVFLPTNNSVSYPISGLMAALCQINDQYDTLGIQFFLADLPSYYYDDNLYQVPNNTVSNNMFDTYNQPNVINVYVTDLSLRGLCGFATFPGSGGGTGLNRGGMFVSYNCLQPGIKTFGHEMGHYLSLFHPFQDGSNGRRLTPNAERVTRNPNEIAPRLSANCATNGDLICDTPTDIVGYRWTCGSINFTDSLDLNGDMIQPDGSLIMGYADNVCRNRFTTQQGAVMRTCITNQRPNLSFFPVPPFNLLNSTATQIVSPAATPLQFLPANHAYFNWRSKENATLYNVKIAANSSMSNVIVDTLVSDTQFVYNGNKLLTSTLYYYTVGAFNPHQPCGAYTAVRQFRTTAPWATNTKNGVLNSSVAFPNPIKSNALLTISFLDDFIPASIQLKNLEGKVIQNFLMPNSFMEDRIELRISNIATGIYLLNIQGKDQSTQVHKLIVLE